MVTVDILTSKHREEWDRFTSTSPEATFYHTFDWTETLRIGSGVIPSFWGLWHDGELAAIWPSCRVRAFGGNVLSTFAYCSNGAPLVKEGFDLELLPKMATHVLESVIKRGVLHWSFDVPQDSYFVKVAPRCGFLSALSPRCSYVVDTSDQPEVLWKRLASEARTAVRKAKKLELKVKDSREPEDLQAFFSIYQSTMQRCRLAGFRDTCSLASLLGDLVDKGRAKLFVTADQNRIVGGIVLLLHSQVAHWWIGGSYPESWRMRPNELLLWTAIEWASKSGYHTLDLGGAPSPQTHGLNVFKRHLGGKRIELIRLVLPVNNVRHLLASKLVNAYRMCNERGLVPAFLGDLLLKGNLWFD